MRLILFAIMTIATQIFLSCADNALMGPSIDKPFFTQLGKDTTWYWGRILSPTNVGGCVMNYDSNQKCLAISMPLDTSANLDELTFTVSQFKGYGGVGHFWVNGNEVVLKRSYYQADGECIDNDSITIPKVCGLHPITFDKLNYRDLYINCIYDESRQKFIPQVTLEANRLTVQQINTLARALGASRWDYYNNSVTISLMQGYSDKETIVPEVIKSLENIYTLHRDKP